jgi:predicted ATP-binding protein involved in virulence
MEQLSQRGAAPRRHSQIVRAIEEALTAITGFSFHFLMKSYPQPSLAVEWAENTLPFDALPDGLRSIIGWMVDAVTMVDAWMQGDGNPANTEAVFLLDEIETNLHPAWQRRILPAFQRLFPKGQIFIATHSPFIISSLNYGWIYPLVIEAGTVKCKQPMPASEGDSYITAVEDIMGVKEWFDPETENLLSEFRSVRDKAYAGELGARPKALILAGQIASRSKELEFFIGREVAQMERQLRGRAE